MQKAARLVLLSLVVVSLDVGTQTGRFAHSFANSSMLYSRDGELHVDLVAAPNAYTVEGQQFQGILYNGAYLPPVWRVQSGDTVTVTLHNRLSEETNLHFHGLDVSPLKNGDNVFLHIPSGESFTYEIKIPEKHVGLFWFQPHLHGDVDRQIIGGMSGGIIVEGSGRLYPFLKDLTERVILFKHHPIGRADYQELVTANGMVAPTIPIRPGEAQFWQIGNIGADRFLRVKIDGMPFLVLGRDGYFLPRPIRMEEALLGPGQRVAAIVVGGQSGSMRSSQSRSSSTSANRHSLKSIWGLSCRKGHPQMLRRLRET